MRNPNGYGCIKHLSGRRRRPFVFVVTDEGRQRPVEYFTNLVDAQIFQADYHRAHHHRSLPGHKITFAELYHRWLPRHTEDTQPSQSTLDSYRNAYQHLSTLHIMPVEDLRYADYQRVIDDMRHHGLSYSSVKKVRSLISLLLKYADKIELSTTNYAPLLSIGRNRPVRPHHTFSRQKINRPPASVSSPYIIASRRSSSPEWKAPVMHSSAIRWDGRTTMGGTARYGVLSCTTSVPMAILRMTAGTPARRCLIMPEPTRRQRGVFSATLAATSQSASIRTKTCDSSANASSCLNNCY